ncbi:hypothetical protein BDQ17DRAFT_1419232 [Cyathus striatus]|nr:hypothetical protein BDQ17DRAFT_1419232 [Cyathus striatus]
MQVVSEPALDVLWSKLDGFYPLAKCLPSHLWIEEERGNRQYVVLRQPLASSDCLRLFFYATKVQDFSADWDGITATQVDTTVYQALQVATEGAKLLPNVQHVAWNCKNDSFQFIHMFLGPRLSEVEFRLSSKSSTQLSLIPALYEHHPSLTSIKFVFSTIMPTVNNPIALISSFVYKWKDLQSLELPNLTYSALLKVSELPYLKRLVMKECRFDSTVTSAAAKGGFPALNSLLLHECHSVSDCIAVLKLIDGSPLRHILLMFVGVETSASWKQVFLAVSQRCQHDTLTQIDCRDGVKSNNDIITSTYEEMVSYETLKSLLVFRNLSWITIEIAKGIQISDFAMVIDMMRSWKEAQGLQVKIPPFSRCEKPKITLEDLIYLAEYCGELEELGLVFDATSPPEIKRSSVSSINIRESELTQLFVGDSPIKTCLGRSHSVRYLSIFEEINHD